MQAADSQSFLTTTRLRPDLTALQLPLLDFTSASADGHESRVWASCCAGEGSCSLHKFDDSLINRSFDSKVVVAG